MFPEATEPTDILSLLTKLCPAASQQGLGKISVVAWDSANQIGGLGPMS